MLTQAYAAIEQFQRQNSNINTIHEIKSFLKSCDIDLSVKISSPTVWVLNWDVNKDCFSGTLELRLEPTLNIGKEVFQMHERSFLLQDPNPNSVDSLELRLVNFIKCSIENIG